MKTKVLLMCAIVALTVYSCSTERDEENKEIPVEVKKTELEKLKINNPQGTANKIESDSTIVGITPYSTPLNSGNGLDPVTGTDPDPNEGGDPKNVPLPPKK
jgi:hypothetical protein